MHCDVLKAEIFSESIQSFSILWNWKKKFIRARWIRDWLEPTRRYSPRSLFIIFSYTTCSQGLEKLLIILLSEKQFYVERKRRMHEKKVKEIKKAENFDLRDITTNARAKAISQTKKKKNSISPDSQIRCFGGNSNKPHILWLMYHKRKLMSWINSLTFIYFFSLLVTLIKAKIMHFFSRGFI